MSIQNPIDIFIINPLKLLIKPLSSQLYSKLVSGVRRHKSRDWKNPFSNLPSAYW